MLNKYVVNWSIPNGSEFSEPMTAKELTDFFVSAPRDKTFRVTTIEEGPRLINPNDTEMRPSGLLESWDEHR